MSDAPENSSLELGRYWATLKSRWLLVLGFTVVGTLQAAAYAVTAPTTYTATAVVNLNVIADEPFNTQRSASGLIDPATEMQLAKSSAVLTDAASDLGGGTTIADVRRSMTVTVLPEATVARITYSDATLDDALAGADAVSQAFVDYRTVAAQDKVDRIRDQLSEQQSTVNRELTAVNKAVADATTGSQRAAAISRRDVLETQVSALLSQLGSVASIDTSGGYVITKAEDNAVAVQPHTRLLVQVGFAAGLVLGIIAAFVVSALDRRLTTTYDVVRASGGPLLARLSDRFLAVPASAADRDSYRSAAERLLALGRGEGGATTVVDLTTHAHATAGANLALGLASSGNGPVLVVFGEGDEDIAADLVADHGGQSVVSPMPAIGGSAVRLCRTKNDQRPDYVVVALPSRAPRSTVLAAARRTGSVVTVVETRRTRADALNGLQDDLTNVGAVVVGTLVAGRRRRRQRRWLPRRERRRVAAEQPVSFATDGV